MGTSTLATIRGESDVIAIQARIEEHRTTLAALRGERDQAEAARDDLRVGKDLGQKIDARRLEMLDHKCDELSRKERQALGIIAALEGHVREAHARETVQGTEAARAELARLSKETAARETAYIQAATAAVEAAQRLLAHRRVFDNAHAIVTRANSHEGTGHRQPYRPFKVPDRFLNYVEPAEHWQQFVREWRETHPGIGENAR